MADPPPNRLKPIPLPILAQACCATENTNPLMEATGDMLCIAFYFLCRPSEYSLSSTDTYTTPFRLRDVELFIGHTRLDVLTAPESSIRAATYALLTFTNQKNTVPGEKIGHGRSGHPYFCPVAALIRRILHLRKHNAPAHTPLHNYFSSGFHHLRSHAVTTLLKRHVAEMGEPFGLLPRDVQARSLRSSGAMALLCARVDHNLIQMLGRWRSDAMFRYLHAQAAPLTAPMAPLMLQFGDFSLGAPH